MDLNQIPIFSALARRMDWLNDRQRVLAQNIANADTPGYKPNDLKPLSFRELVRGVRPGGAAMAATDARHLTGTKEQVKFTTQKSGDPFEVSPSGNAVVLEQQVANMAETQMDFSTATSLYKKHIGLLRAAIGRRGM